MRPRDRPRPASEKGTRRSASARARRTELRRRRAALLVLLAGAAALLAILLSGGTGAHPGRTRVAGASGASSVPAPSGVRRAAGRGSSTAAGYPETAAVRSLVAGGRPIYCAGPRGNEVALTFDDGPGPYTRLMIAKLRKHGAEATFFIVGRNIDLVPGAVRAERALGAVGDHTFTHPLLTSLDPASAEQQIASTQAAVARASGGPVFLFRPPYGARNATIDGIVRSHGLLQILWTVDSADSLGANYAQIERNVIAGLRPGAIILMHENHGQTIRAMINIFAAIRRKGLRAVSVPQLLADDPPSAAQLRDGGLGCGVAHGVSLTGG